MMESIVGEEIEQEIQGQRQLEREYDALIAEREEMQMTGATDFALRVDILLRLSRLRLALRSGRTFHPEPCGK